MKLAMWDKNKVLNGFFILNFESIKLHFHKKQNSAVNNHLDNSEYVEGVEPVRKKISFLLLYGKSKIS